MTNSYKLFQKNIESIDTIDNIYIFFAKEVKAIDLSEILRAQYVLLVSSFDYFIHDLVKDGMLAIFDGTKPKNKSYDDFSISLKSLDNILSTNDTNKRKEILDFEIRKITSKDSYQSPSSVEKALNLLDLTNIWTNVSDDLNLTAKEIKTTLGLIVHRRNKIAHEADIDPSTNLKTIIDRETVLEAKIFIQKLALAIDKKI